jgi:hypothetical protein
MAPGAIPAEGANEVLVPQLLTRAQAMLDDVAFAHSQAVAGIQLWGAHVVDRQQERAERLEALQRALENIRRRDSVGKMNKLSLGSDLLRKAAEGKVELAWIQSVISSRGRLADPVEFLRGAEAAFGESDPMGGDTQAFREEVLGMFTSSEPLDPTKVAEIRSAAEDLRRRYVAEAARAHARDRLDAAGDQRKRMVLESPAYRDVKRLAELSLLPKSDFAAVERSLLDIRSCTTFDDSKLRASVRCPDCGYEPRAGSGPTARARVEELDSEVVRLRAGWERTLAENVRAPELTSRVELLAPGDRAKIETFTSEGRLPDPVDHDFIRAVAQLLERFEVHRINAGELWNALFPVSGPATIGQLEARLQEFLDGLHDGTPAEKVRIVPATEEE